MVILSEKQQRFNGVTYYLCGFYFQNKGVRLHKKVWEYYNGEIPKGYHVHHKDGNRSNNDISNLELKPLALHLSEHSKSREDYNKKHINEIRALASEWHGSKEGRAWHKVHAVEMWEGIEPKKYICKVCGKEFESRMLDTEKIKFCSNNCKAAARRKSRVDSVESVCVWCGKKYTKNRHSKGMTCSRDCAAKKRWDGYESKGGKIRG